MLVNEIFSRHWRDRKAVARYAGLTGSPDESGSRRRERVLRAPAMSRPLRHDSAGLAFCSGSKEQRPGPMVSRREPPRTASTRKNDDRGAGA